MQEDCPILVDVSVLMPDDERLTKTIHEGLEKLGARYEYDPEEPRPPAPSSWAYYTVEGEDRLRAVKSLLEKLGVKYHVDPCDPLEDISCDIECEDEEDLWWEEEEEEEEW